MAGAIIAAMNTNDLIKYYKSRANAQLLLGVSKSLFSRWKKGGIPAGRQAAIQIVTRGKLRAEKTK